MSAILLLLTLLGFCLTITRYWKWPAETTPFFVTSSIMASLYIAASAHLLAPVSKAIFFLGLALFFWHLFIHYHEKSKRKEPVLGYSLVLFSAFCLLLWLKVGDGVVVNNDDFSHWALVAKDMYLTHSLASSDGYIVFKDYPPGTALFQYFLFRINDLYMPSGYSEGAAMLAQGVLLIASLLPLLAVASRYNKKLTLLVGFTLYFALFAFGPGLRSLNVDHVLAAYFGMALATWWLTGRDLHSILRITPVIICLPIIKSTGTFFAGLLIVILVLYQIYQHHAAANGGNNKKPWSVWLLLLMMIALLFMTHASWKGHVADIHAGQTLSTKTSLTEIKRSLFGIATEKENKITENYLDKLKPLRLPDPDNGIMNIKLQRTAFFIWVLLCVSLIIIRWIALKDKAGAILVLSGLVLGLLTYMLGLLLLYFFSFGEFEAVRLASFDRYIAIYILAWMLVIMALFLQMLEGASDDTNKRAYGGLVALLILCVSFGFGGGGGAKFLAHDLSKPSAKGSVIRPLIQKFRHILTADTTVFFVWQHGTGFPCYVAKYEAIPARVVNAATFQTCSLGEPYGDGDLWTRNISPQQWSRELSIYDYVMLGYADKKFWHTFGMLFKDVHAAKTKQLFRIEKKSGEMVKLISVVPQ